MSGSLGDTDNLRLSPRQVMTIAAYNYSRPGDVSLMEFSPNDTGSILTQVTGYMFDCNEEITAGYSYSSFMAGGSSHVGSYNAYLGQTNIAYVSNTSNEHQAIRMRINEGIATVARRDIEFNPHQSRVIDLNSYGIEPNTYGNVRYYTASTNPIIIQHLRVRALPERANFSIATSVR